MEEGRSNRTNPAEVFQATNSTGDSSFIEKDSNSSILEVTIEKNTVPTRQYRMNPKVFEAASTGNLSFFEQAPNSDLQEVTPEENTVLHVALQFKQFEAAEKIVNLCPSLVSKTNSKGNTPLHVAAMVGSVGRSSLVKILIQKAEGERDVETGGRQRPLSMVNQDGDTALHVAVRYGNFDVVKELINENDPAELAMQANKAGESALFLAVDSQAYEMASYILRAAPDCSYAGRHGMNVLHALVIHTSSYSNKEDIDLERDMENYGQIPGCYRLVLTFYWVINMLILFPVPQFDLERLYEIKDLILRHKRGKIRKDFVREVMEKCRSTIEQRDDSGWTPLHIAAHMGNEEFVKLLLEKDNSPAYVRNSEGLSALHIAAKEDHHGVMDILMKKCPDIYELLDNKGRNALHAAAESEKWEAFKLFKARPEFGSLINLQDKEGNTPMHLAVINGHYEIVGELKPFTGIQLNATNKEGFTKMDNFLLERELQDYESRILWRMGGRLSLRGALIKMGIRNLDPRSQPKKNSLSVFWKRMRETNLLVVTLIATVTFTAAFTVPGGYNQNESKNGDDGLAVLRKRTTFGVFLIANTLAFGLSTTSVFLHFFASATIEDNTFHKKVARRISFFTNWSIGALLVAFIAGTCTVVPGSLGNFVAFLLCCCFLSNMLFPLSMKKKEKFLSDS